MNEFASHFDEINQEFDNTETPHQYSPTTTQEELFDICKDVVSIQKHNQAYDSLLNMYNKHIEQTLELKSNMKKEFFEWCKGIMIYVCIAYIGIGAIIFACHLHGIVISDEKFRIFFGSTFATFLTSFISIPVIIAKYLFHPEEEKSATQIIKNMQKHDKVIRKILFKNNGRR